MFQDFQVKREQCLNAKLYDYSGTFSKKTIDTVSDNIEMCLFDIPARKLLNILSFVNELLSIFQKNSIEKYKENSYFCICNLKSEILIYVHNFISFDIRTNTALVIDEINACIEDKERLKLLYQGKLESFEIDERSSLGYLGIARKTGKALLYSSSPYDAESHVFSLIITVPLEIE